MQEFDKGQMRFIAILLFKLLNWRKPTLMPIERIEDYHTHYLGQTSDGRLFWGYETFVFTKPPGERGTDWQQHRKEYVVLHTFDKKGNYLQISSVLSMNSPSLEPFPTTPRKNLS